MRIGFTARRQADLEVILRHVGEENPLAAAKLVESIEIEALSRHPEPGSATRPPGRRVLTVPGAPYRAFCHLGADRIRILHVRHTSRRPPSS